ncbi:expressed unknown protein [Seminavis robusta]|uniref:Uncharacterized protein n=1 Tax=Seminavis robusta TaxID=568900 RepID=A0A9N8D7P7_9STRA|nr:expressed unknown protein [Seminavis robusta]|eukprot:Sro31_g020320.1 n/a (218) ;mRNA; f:93759-94412
MCMTSNNTPMSGYASPSNLPYSDDCGMSSCELEAFKVPPPMKMMMTPSSAPAMITPPTTTKNEAPLAYAAFEDHERLRSRRRPRTLQDLPLPLRKRTCQTPKDRFAAFVAILLMYLNSGGTKTYKLSIQAKALVAECCRRNQMGDAHFTPLNDSMAERLHGLVGAQHWDRAATYLYIYLARHHGFQPGRDETEEDRRLLHHSPAKNKPAPLGHQFHF